MRTVVVLPDPLGPIMEKNSPARTVKDTESSARVSPKRRDTSSNSTAESRASDSLTPPLRSLCRLGRYVIDVRGGMTSDSSAVRRVARDVRLVPADWAMQTAPSVPQRLASVSGEIPDS